MESWRKVWRKGIAPNLPREGLEALRTALVEDDPALIQGATTTPPPLQCVEGKPCEQACALGYPGWKAGGMTTVAQVEQFFAKICFDADQLMNEPAAVRFFLNWYDEVPREEMRRELTLEVEAELTRRSQIEKVA